MNIRQDYYPTRTVRSLSYFHRLDPVVYSKNNFFAKGPLAADSLRSYNENGFLFLDSFYSEDTVSGFLQDLKDYSYDASFKDKEQVIVEPQSRSIRSIFGIHQLSERFQQLTCDALLLDIAYQILNSDVYIHQSRLNNKPGFTGTGFNWHSDFETWHSEDGMPKMRCFSLSILLTENSPLNGPLMLIPGSQRYFIPTQGQTPPQHWKTSLKNQTIGVPDTDTLFDMTKRGGIAAPAGPAGSLLIFDCNTLHASANNLSPFPRSNLFFVYNSIENKLQQPYCGQAPRPEFIATRSNNWPLQPIVNDITAPCMENEYVNPYYQKPRSDNQYYSHFSSHS